MAKRRRRKHSKRSHAARGRKRNRLGRFVRGSGRKHRTRRRRHRR